MALSFRPPGGEEWRTGMNDIPVFTVRDAKGFLDGEGPELDARDLDLGHLGDPWQVSLGPRQGRSQHLPPSRFAEACQPPITVQANSEHR